MKLYYYSILLILTFGQTKLFAQEISEPIGSDFTLESAKEALEFHNQVRKDVGVEPLVWSAELSAFAQEWADYLANSKSCQLIHRPNSGEFESNYGENIYWGWNNSVENEALIASQLWYSEIQSYVHEPINDTNYLQTGHYSQMVWYNSKEIGMGFAECRDGAKIVVANYNPPGNFWGEKPY